MAETTYHMLNKFFLEASFKTWRIFCECISRRLGERLLQWPTFSRLSKLMSPKDDEIMRNNLRETERLEIWNSIN
ncbi:hypothetical protein D917_10014 [Trichinella nativa]|uniref:Uncharacterized protein n=1 Tax=Trichinella nativa TaxID=6335 RepID=A0A1Y3EGZ2_9BILA|nr:hypothetical protein D917_10014 [Trichinella nativa]